MCALMVFDLDDTLYKERDYVRSGRRAVANAIGSELGLDADGLMALMEAAPDAFDAVSAAIAGLAGADAWPVSRMVDTYRAHTPEISLDADTRLVLEALRRRHTLAIVTDGNSVRQHAKIKALGLYEFFSPENIYVSDDAGSDKNTPVPFLAMERRHSSMRRYYVGDNLAKDFHWPGLRGWTTVMLIDSHGTNIWPQYPAAAPLAFRPGIAISSLKNLLTLP